MNSIVLMAEIVTDPEKRLTADGQYTTASFIAQFPSPRQDDVPFRVRVMGWNRLADEIMDRYHRGDQVIVEGRLRMELIDRGAYKEKVAEITAQRVYSMGANLPQVNPPTDSYGYANSPAVGSWSDHSYQSVAPTVPKANNVPVANQSGNSSGNSYGQPATSYPNMAPSTQGYDLGGNDDDIPF